jgi:hypothetical protein
MEGVVIAVSRSATHRFSKPNQRSIRLLAGLGIEGDAHMGVTVKHRSRVARDPTRPNLKTPAATALATGAPAGSTDVLPAHKVC